MRTYEELTGARGSRVFYRAERFKARDLFVCRPPQVSFAGTEFDLDNLSMTGLAASRKAEVEVAKHDTDDVAIIFEGDNQPLFCGKGRVERVERDPLQTRVALSFTGAPLDVPGLIRRHRESLLKRDLNGGLHHSLDLVTPDYRQHCVDVLHLLRRYKNTIEEFAEPGSDEEHDSIFYDLCEQRLLPEWRKLWWTGNELTRPLVDDPDRLQAAKDFTENVLTPDFLQGAIWNRSYLKPLGYPGDYEIMNYVYSWGLPGKTIFAKLLHRIGLDVVECIAARMDLVQHEIANTVAADRESDEAVRILSLGCGPAQEIYNYLSLPDLPRPVEFTLVDQDKRALTFAYERSYPKIMHRGDGSKLRCLQLSFTELLRSVSLFNRLPPQDLIYSVGLIDYLSMKRAQSLLRAVFERLVPGGQLIIGNVADVSDSLFWPSEFICDWSMKFRTPSEMKEMTALIPDARIRLESDPTGRFHILYVQKS